MSAEALQAATPIERRYERIMSLHLQHYPVTINADVHAIEEIVRRDDDTLVYP